MFRPPADSIIFDLDGTLWDASPTSAIAWSKVAANLGIDVSIDESSIKRVSGLPFDKCVDVLFGSHAQKIPDLKSQLDKSERDEVLHRPFLVKSIKWNKNKPLAGSISPTMWRIWMSYMNPVIAFHS